MRDDQERLNIVELQTNKKEKKIEPKDNKNKDQKKERKKHVKNCQRYSKLGFVLLVWTVSESIFDPEMICNWFFFHDYQNSK